MTKKNESTSRKENEIMEEPVLTKTYLNDEELEHFRLLLLKRREEVLRDLDVFVLATHSNLRTTRSSHSLFTLITEHLIASLVFQR